MFGWLKKKAAQQSLFNVRINSRTLILVADEADERIRVTRMADPVKTREVVHAQQALLRDAQLALQNGASMGEVSSQIEAAKGKHPPSEGALMAIANVLRHLPQ
jgi:hypothetical protein